MKGRTLTVMWADPKRNEVVDQEKVCGCSGLVGSPTPVPEVCDGHAYLTTASESGSVGVLDSWLTLWWCVL